MMPFHIEKKMYQIGSKIGSTTFKTKENKNTETKTKPNQCSIEFQLLIYPSQKKHTPNDTTPLIKSTKQQFTINNLLFIDQKNTNHYKYTQQSYPVENNCMYTRGIKMPERQCQTSPLLQNRDCDYQESLVTFKKPLSLQDNY